MVTQKKYDKLKALLIAERKKNGKRITEQQTKGLGTAHIVIKKLIDFINNNLKEQAAEDSEVNAAPLTTKQQSALNVAYRQDLNKKAMPLDYFQSDDLNQVFEGFLTFSSWDYPQTEYHKYMAQAGDDDDNPFGFNIQADALFNAFQTIYDSRNAAYEN